MNSSDMAVDAIEQLQKRIRACRLCQQHGYIPVAHPIVSGHAYDRMLVIGQAPGHLSTARDRPFSGPGGMVLQKWLERAGFAPGYLHEHTYLSSLTRCDPGKNPRGSGDRKPSPAEIALCRPYLQSELTLLKARVVLLVGTMAIEAFLPQGKKAKLEEIIGTYWEEQGSFFLPLPHPSGVSRWLNAPEHKELHAQALAHLERWRKQYEL